MGARGRLSLCSLQGLHRLDLGGTPPFSLYFFASLSSSLHSFSPILSCSHCFSQIGSGVLEQALSGKQATDIFEQALPLSEYPISPFPLFSLMSPSIPLLHRLILPNSSAFRQHQMKQVYKQALTALSVSTPTGPSTTFFAELSPSRHLP